MDCGSYAAGTGWYQRVYVQLLRTPLDGHPASREAQVLQSLLALRRMAQHPSSVSDELRTHARNVVRYLADHEHVTDTLYPPATDTRGAQMENCYREVRAAMNAFDEYSLLEIADCILQYHDCAVNVVCHVARTQFKAMLIQKIWRRERYHPDGTLFKRWARRTADKYAMGR